MGAVRQGRQAGTYRSQDQQSHENDRTGRAGSWRYGDHRRWLRLGRDAGFPDHAHRSRHGQGRAAILRRRVGPAAVGGWIPLARGCEVRQASQDRPETRDCHTGGVTMKSATILSALGIAAIAIYAQDAVTAPQSAEKKGKRQPPPGVSTPGVKKEMSAITPATVFPLPGTPDWQVVTDDAVWVSNGPKNTIHRLDVKTNTVAATIEVGKRPCSGLAAGFGSVWVPLCGDRPNVENGAKPALARVDIKTNTVVATIPVLIANSEGGLTTSPDAI